MALSKEMYTVGVLFIQYAFPLASIVFAYSRIARRMGTRFAPRPSYLHPSIVTIMKTDAELMSSTDKINNIINDSTINKNQNSSLKVENNSLTLIKNGNAIINRNSISNVKYVNSNIGNGLLLDQNLRNKLVL